MGQVERYLRNAARVDGWLAPYSARFIAELADIQRRHGVDGAVAEIGVHHGRLFILMHLAGGGRRDLAIDIFDDQHLNEDSSGLGNKSVFLSNLEHWGGDPARVEILQKSSLSVSPGEITAAVGPVAMFSIDGGHTAECAENDLRLAEAVLHHEGVVVLDDYFHEFWPEVHIGAAAYLNDPSSELRPFAITAGKLYLCRPVYNARYREAITKAFPTGFDKEVMLYGETVQIMGFTHKPLNAVSRLRRAVARSPVGPLLRTLLRRPKLAMVGRPPASRRTPAGS